MVDSLSPPSDSPESGPPSLEEPGSLASVLTRIARGDPQAIGPCIDIYGSLVWSMARRMSLTSADAEDAVQEIFLDVWRHAKRYNPKLGSEKVFISVLARRRLIDRARKMRRQRAIEHPLASEHDNLPANAAAEHDAEVAEACSALQALPVAHQQAISLALVEGLSHAEIAHRLGWPLGTVKTVIRRGILRLRELVTKQPARASLERGQ